VRSDKTGRRVRLLNRSTRRISLTAVGRDYYERCYLMRISRVS
jgi:hypothetical protein